MCVSFVKFTNFFDKNEFPITAPHEWLGQSEPITLRQFKDQNAFYFTEVDAFG